MARGKRSYTLEELLQKVTKDISTKEEEIKNLKEQKKQLEEQLKQKRLLELETAISKSGKTIEEVLALFKTQTKMSN